MNDNILRLLDLIGRALREERDITDEELGTLRQPPTATQLPAPQPGVTPPPPPPPEPVDVARGGSGVGLPANGDEEGEAPRRSQTAQAPKEEPKAATRSPARHKRRTRRA